MRIALVLALMTCLITGFALFSAQQRWETKPYMQWSKDDVTWVLHYSPWISVSAAGVRQEARLTHDKGVVNGPEGQELPEFAPEYDGSLLTVNYVFRLLTARPVREALLRSISLGDIISPIVDIADFGKKSLAEEEQSHLDRFMISYPNSPILKGEDEFIIIGISLRVGVHESLRRWTEESNGEELSRMGASSLMQNARLSTNTGKKVRLANYRPAGAGWITTQLLFPRYLPDRHPLVEFGDKELLLETWINGKTVRAKFNLSKMVYKGRLEF